MINQNIILEYGLTESFDEHMVSHKELTLLETSQRSDIVNALNILDNLDVLALKIIQTYLELSITE